MKILLEKGANPSSADENDESCLHYSIGIQSIENTRLLLEAGAQVEARNLRDETPLFTTVHHRISGSRDIMRILLEHGANANADSKSLDGHSCLHMAVISGDVLKIQMLLEEGANIDARSSWGDSVLQYAARFSDTNTDVLKCLLNKHEDQGTLTNALEGRNNDGCIALHLAASSGSHIAVKILVKYGASVEAKDKDGDTPLHAAIRSVRDRRRLIIVDMPKGGIKEAVANADVCRGIVTLLDAGADPLAVNELGVTPMATATGAPQFEALHGMKS